MKDINLLNPKIARKMNVDNKVFVIIIVSFLICIATLSCGLEMLCKKNNRDIESIRTDMIRFTKVKNLKNNIKLYNEKMGCMQEALDSVASSSIINTKLIKEIAKAMPDDVYLLNYSITKIGEIDIVGSSKKNESIAYFSNNLKASSMFKDAVIKDIKSETTKDDGTSSTAPSSYSFDITIKIRY